MKNYKKESAHQKAIAVILALALLLHFLKNNPEVMDAVTLWIFGAK